MFSFHDLNVIFYSDMQPQTSSTLQENRSKATKRQSPSEWDCDSEDEKAHHQALFNRKKAIRKLLTVETDEMKRAELAIDALEIEKYMVEHSLEIIRSKKRRPDKSDEEKSIMADLLQIKLELSEKKYELSSIQLERYKRDYTGENLDAEADFERLNERLRLHQRAFDHALNQVGQKTLSQPTGAEATEDPPRAVWYSVNTDLNSTLSSEQVESILLYSSQLLDNLREHCARRQDDSVFGQSIQSRIKLFDANKKLLDIGMRIGDLETTPDPPLRVVIPRANNLFVWEPLVPSHSLDKGHLYFVNRDKAVRELLDVFITNTARKHGSGPLFKVGIIDQAFGTGKTELGQNFVTQCKHLLTTGVQDNRATLEKISKSRTLVITLEEKQLYDIMVLEDGLAKREELQATMVDEILCSVTSQVGEEVARYLHNFMQQRPAVKKKCRVLLRELKKVTGGDPIFIVLDEVGAAFDGPKSDVDRRDLFVQFCNQFLISWLRLQGLYFFITGRGSIFEWVADRPSKAFQPLASPLIFVRINLNMIRRDKIKTILRNTTRGLLSGAAVTLVEYYKLAPSDEDAVIDTILKQTNGHARSIWNMLHKCESKKDLLIYQDPGHFDQDPINLLLSYRLNVQTLLKHVEDETQMNLSVPIQGRPMEYSDLVNRAKLRWEGDASNAMLYASPAVLRALACMSSSFAGYLKVLIPDPHLILQWDRYFEILLIKRFQSMFEEPFCPGGKYPTFFPKSTPFGSLREFQASPEIVGFPKITNHSDENRSPKMDSRTANPLNWYKLLQLMADKGSGCFLPATESSSSDGYIVYTNSSKTTQVTVVGVAAKCIAKPLGETSIADEIKLFNRTFNRPPDAPTVPKAGTMIGKLHVLLTVSTGGFSNEVLYSAPKLKPDPKRKPAAKRKPAPKRKPTKKQAPKRKVAKPPLTIQAIPYNFDRTKYSNVHSVLLIGLSTPQLRAEFFGITHDQMLQNNLEFITNPRHPMRPQQ
jgi:hypothetical protein